MASIIANTHMDLSGTLEQIQRQTDQVQVDSKSAHQDYIGQIERLLQH